MSPEQSFLKLKIRSHFSNIFNKKMIHFDLICNEFEYEILYKKTFPELTGGGLNAYSSPSEGGALKHKRGNS
jgi:hypothetical protein